MADRPILFSAPMVRAILREIKQPGTGKTQTRRIIKPQPEFSRHHLPVRPESRGGRRWVFMCRTDFPSYGWATADFKAPCEVGDRLWVREAHYLTDDGDYERAVYATDEDSVREHLATVNALPEYFSAELRSRHKRLRPGIHMPRWASRITLAVTGVRVQRLQDISEDDARAEGIQCRAIKCSDGVERVLWFGVPQAGHDWSDGQGPIQAFADLWDSINNHRGLCADDAPSGWTANPWVVAITFRPILANIDRVEALAA